MSKEKTLADEFLAQNEKTVLYRIKNNELTAQFIDELVELESSNINRESVLEALNLKKEGAPDAAAEAVPKRTLAERVEELEKRQKALEKRVTSLHTP